MRRDADIAGIGDVYFGDGGHGVHDRRHPAAIADVGLIYHVIPLPVHKSLVVVIAELLVLAEHFPHPRGFNIGAGATLLRIERIAPPRCTCR
jgi:hypothetical protein